MAKVQMLKSRELELCNVCGLRVRWRVRSTYKCADGLHKIEYLRCPTNGCKGCAERLVEIPEGDRKTL